MKKICCMFLCIIMTVTTLSLPATAVNDAKDLSYKIAMKVADEKGNAKTSFNVGETVVVQLSIEQLGKGAAPLYAMQGELICDLYCLQYASSNVMENTQVAVRGNRVAFAYIDKYASEIPMQKSHNIGSFSFVARFDGTVEFSLDKFIITNKDASIRSADASEAVTVKIGTGIRKPDRGTLLADITAARKNLESAIVTDNPSDVFYPAFSVTARAANVFKLAIAEAQKIHDDANASVDQVSGAIARLADASSIFELEKRYGPENAGGSTGGSAGGAVIKVSVKATADKNGTILSQYLDQNVIQGTSVTIIARPNEGYDTEYVYVNSKRFEGSDVFTLPYVDKDTEVRFTFCKKPAFADVKAENWYYTSVRFVTNRGLFKGVDEQHFMPAGNMDRAMLATVLYRMAGEAKAEKKAVFTDVEPGQWYTDAIDWAVQNSVMIGLGTGEFGTTTPITREQIATVLYRYSGEDKKEKPSLDGINAFSDASKISSWATDAMAWANNIGLIKGVDSTQLAPLKTATRAELAAIMTRFCETFNQ